MLAHLILTLTLLLSREENVKACLPFDYSQDDFDRKDVELAAGLGVAVGLLVRFHESFVKALFTQKFRICQDFWIRNFP